ncbi:MAG: hydrogenase expression/formation protein HypE [Chthoniobacterales bacterium]|nr:hydrogenase expression/formation protein HypE [Chthoniobacterales bacterium]
MTSCPLPFEPKDTVTMAHGAGGRHTFRLIQNIFAPAFHLSSSQLSDSAIVGDEEKWAISTDAHVVSPLFFPGGDIGTLAANGTCNDLAMVGAEPKWLAVSWILEEGITFDTLNRISQSLAAAAAQNGATIIAGDTKVVPKGKGDGLYLSSAGFGLHRMPFIPSPSRLKPGLELIISGDIGRHAIAIASLRDNSIGFSAEIASDCCPLWPLVAALLNNSLYPAAMRDCTRGGLATVLAEWAEESNLGMELEEEAVPLLEPVRAACDLLGFDPLYLACEGRFLLAIEKEKVEDTLNLLRQFPDGKMAARIGRVTNANPGRAVARQPYGTERILDRLSGEILPRIC